MNKRVKYLFIFMTFIVGYLSLSIELVVLRQLMNFSGSNALITSIIIATVLAFMSIGYYRGSTMQLNTARVRHLFARDMKRITLWIILSCSLIPLTIYFLGMQWIGISSNLLRVTLFSLVFLAYPSMLFGKISSLTGRYLHRTNRHYTGCFMAIDTIGSVVGSLLTTLVLMPFIGVSMTVLFLTFISVTTAFFLSKKKPAFWAVTIMLIAIGINYPPTRFLVKEDGISTIAVMKADLDTQQRTFKSRIMMLNGSFASKVSTDPELEAPNIRYINEQLLYHMPKDTPKDVLVLGAGGFAMGEKDAFHNYTYVDVDPKLKEIAEKHFYNGNPLTPNKKLVAQDAYFFMLDDTKKYDVILLDVYPANAPMPMEFMTHEFFTQVRHHIKPGGTLAINAISDASFYTPLARNLDYTLRAVFPQNLSRQVIQDYNPYQKTMTNVLYFWYDRPEDGHLYTMDKNTSFYDYEE